MEIKRSHETSLFLPPRVDIPQRSGVDRYGLSSVIAKKLGMRSPKRSFANWVHGWMWFDVLSAKDLACHGLPKATSVIVRSPEEKKCLMDEGFTNVVVGGLPFAYVQPTNLIRKKYSLLAVPPHSAEAEKFCGQLKDFYDSIFNIRNDYEEVKVLVFGLDKGGEIDRQARKSGLDVIYGALPNDANSLYRMRAIFDYFECVTSSSIGSHFLYSQYSGAKFSFFGNYTTYDRECFVASGNPHKHSSEHIDRVMHRHSEGYIRDLFGDYFVNHPQEGKCDVEFSRQQIGENYLLSSQEIKQALGWGMSGQFAGYAVGAKRRLERLIMDRL